MAGTSWPAGHTSDRPQRARYGLVRIGLVLPGGGARGAYEAGALSVLTPALEARGERVEIVCGTSVGGINAAFVAAIASLPACDQAATFLDRWRSVRKSSVIRPVIGVGT